MFVNPFCESLLLNGIAFVCGNPKRERFILVVSYAIVIVVVIVVNIIRNLTVKIMQLQLFPICFGFIFFFFVFVNSFHKHLNTMI